MPQLQGFHSLGEPVTQGVAPLALGYRRLSRCGSNCHCEVESVETL